MDGSRKYTHVSEQIELVGEPAELLLCMAFLSTEEIGEILPFLFLFSHIHSSFPSIPILFV